MKVLLEEIAARPFGMHLLEDPLLKWVQVSLNFLACYARERNLLAVCEILEGINLKKKKNACVSGLACSEGRERKNMYFPIMKTLVARRTVISKTTRIFVHSPNKPASFP